jgi:hypothetical protein
MSEKNDLQFLKEMRERLTKAPYDGTQYEFLGNMIDDWIHELAAAPSQEVEPVYQVRNAFDTPDSWGALHEVSVWLDVTKQMYDCETKLEKRIVYLYPPSAEQAAADMKRRCVEIIQKEMVGEKAGYGFDSKTVLAAIESLPISDMALEEMRKDAERLDWLDKQSGAIRRKAYGEYELYFDPATESSFNEPTARGVIDNAIAAEKVKV